jgi:hypothetical protein
MRHANRLYYVDLLKAAELHGASHQAVMEFQVVTNRQMRDVWAGRSKIAFYSEKICRPSHRNRRAQDRYGQDEDLFG